MKSWVAKLALCLLLLAVLQLKLTAQSCISFSDDYASYYDYSTDGTNIYTSVVVDGQGEMNISNGNGCSMIDYGSIVHWPQGLNVISIPGTSTYVGGVLNGSQVCPDCYLSETNSQSIAATPGIGYTFNWGNAVICSLAGQIFGSNGYIGISIKVGTYILNTINPDGSANYKLACPGTSTSSCGAANLGPSQHVDKWAEELFLSATIGGSRPICVPPGIVTYFNGPPAPLPCS
jgi:hypothetical protein